MPAGRAENLFELVRSRDLELIVAAVRRPLVRPPALKDRGVPVKLILYKGFGHPINKPKQQRAVMEHNYEWFSKYIWGEEVTQSRTAEAVK